jgi:hypothetical protein
MQRVAGSHRKTSLVHCFDLAYRRFKLHVQGRTNRKHPISGEHQILAIVARRGYANRHNESFVKRIVSHDRQAENTMSL